VAQSTSDFDHDASCGITNSAGFNAREISCSDLKVNVPGIGYKDTNVSVTTKDGRSVITDSLSHTQINILEDSLQNLTSLEVPDDAVEENEACDH